MAQMSHHTRLQKEKNKESNPSTDVDNDTDTGDAGTSEDNDSEIFFDDTKGRYDDFGDTDEDDTDTSLDEEDESNEANSSDDEDTVDPLVNLAKSKGHMDYDNWVAAGRDPDEWVSAKMFLKIGEDRNRYSATVKKMKEQDSAIKQLVQFQQNMLNGSHEDTLAVLEEQKAEAVKIGDGETVVEVDKKIRKLEQQKQSVPEYKPTEVDTTDNESAGKEYFDTVWLPKNPWFVQPGLAKQSAIGYAEEYVKTHGADSPAAAVFSYVDSQMKEYFPGIVGTKKPKPTNKGKSGRGTNRLASAQGRGAAKGKAKYGKSDLTRSELNMFHQIKRLNGGNYTIDQYVAGLKSGRK